MQKLFFFVCLFAVALFIIKPIIKLILNKLKFIFFSNKLDF